MAFRLEGTDIVISGFEQGIAANPYAGIADMRNLEIITLQGEASVQFANTTASLPPALNAVAYTASATTDRLTWAGPNTLYEGCAISLTPANITLNYLVVAGGGGGGGDRAAPGGEGGGGGGAGGMKTGTLSFSTGTATYAVTVGAGGTAGSSSGGAGGDGANSSIAALVVSTGGGGGGGPISTNGHNGGSGGGASAVQGGSSGTAGTGSAGQGNNGGTGAVAGVASGGGGGGSSAVGANAAGAVAGNGGAGTASSISGASVTYAGGGGGAGNTAGTGGAGGGGNGNNGGNGAAGTANTGGGGGGGYGGAFTGGAGGSGTVVVSYTTGSLSATGGTITTSGGNTIHTFNSSADFVVTGLVSGTVYYVRNIVGTTFQLSLSPLGAIVDILLDASGTFTTYQYGNQRGLATSQSPNSYFVDRSGSVSGLYTIFLVDGSNYAWLLSNDSFGNIPANSLVFLGNIGGVGAGSASQSGVAVWNEYLFVFGNSSTGLDIANVDDLLNDGPAVAWDYQWQTPALAAASNQRVATLLSQEDSNLYFLTTSGLGSLLLTPGEVFDPSDTTTYSFTDDAISLPTNDRATCIGELGPLLYIGGRISYVYMWDKISPGFNSILTIPEVYVWNVIGTGQNAFIFAGNKGRIFVTNSAAVDEYKKVSPYVTGAVNPYFRFLDASFSRGRVYFTFIAQTNADTILTTVNGVWCVDISTGAWWMTNKLTNSGYGGRTTMAVETPILSQADQVPGVGLSIGWSSSTPTYGIDVGTSDPYTNYESFIDTELIPVGTFLSPWTPSQIEFKTSAPLVSGEGVKISYRTNLTDSFTQVGETTTAGAISDLYTVNFQQAQWVQFRIETKSTASSPSYTRLTEMRIRDWPRQGK